MAVPAPIAATEGGAPPANGAPGEGPRRGDGARISPTSERALRLRELLRLDTPRATLLHWSAIALVITSIFVSDLLPCTDYAQHLGLSDVARRLFDDAAPEHARFTLNYFTYNGLFHVVVARLGQLMPIELAGKLVVAFALLLMGGSVLALLRTLGRPPIYAALFTPLIFSFSVGFGFVNFALGVAIATATVVVIVRSLLRPTLAGAIAVAMLGLLCAFTHVLAMLILCVLAASLAPELALRTVEARDGRLPAGVRAWRALLACVRALCPLLLACVFCVLVYRRQHAWNPGLYTEPTLEGTAPPIWKKVALFGFDATGYHPDGIEAALVYVASIALLSVAIAAAVRRARSNAARAQRRSELGAPIYGPLLAFAIAYFAVPMVFMGTYFIFPRLAQPLFLAALLAAPRAAGASRALRTTALTVALCAGVSIVVHAVAFRIESSDLSRVIDEAPAGRRAASLVYDEKSYAFRDHQYVHLAGYYGARKHGEWAFSFARYQSVPVIFRVGGTPPWPKHPWEFKPYEYDARSRYARAHDLLFVRAPMGIDDEQSLRALAFGRDATTPALVAHHGRFWCFDTAGIPADDED